MKYILFALLMGSVFSGIWFGKPDLPISTKKPYLNYEKDKRTWVIYYFIIILLVSFLFFIKEISMILKIFFA